MDDQKDQENIDVPQLEPEAQSISVAADQSPPEPAQPTTPEVFIDNPATQPPLPENIQSAQNDQTQAKPKKSKKLLIALLVLLLATAIGAAYYFLVFAKEEVSSEPTPQAATNETVSVDSLLYQTNTQFKSYDVAAQSAVDEIKIPDGAEVLKASADGNEIIYASYASNSEANDTTTFSSMKVVKATADKEDTLLTTTTLTRQPIASPVVSPDMKKIAYYAVDEANEQTYQTTAKIYTAELDGSNKEAVLANGSNSTGDIDAQHGPLRPTLWSADNSALYLAAVSCYECDGPITANVWKITTADSSLKKIFAQPEGTTSGNVVTSPNGEYLAVEASSSDGGIGDPDFDKIAENGFDVYKISVSDDSSSKLYSEIPFSGKESESFQTIAGWSQDSSNVLVGVPVITKATSGIGFDRKFNRFDAVNVADGKVSQIPVESKSLDQAGSLTATTYSKTLFISVDNPYIEGAAGPTYSFLSLPLDKGVSEIKTIESSTPKIKILGSGTTTKNQN